jgi:hypothetical protein
MIKKSVIKKLQTNNLVNDKKLVHFYLKPEQKIHQRHQGLSFAFAMQQWAEILFCRIKTRRTNFKQTNLF